MAEFNQSPQAQGPASYTGMSEGIRSSPNTSMATLFEGLADAFTGAVKTVDQGIKTKIEEDIFAEVDAVQAEFGVPEATDLQSDEGEASFRTSPVGVQRAGDQLQRLQTAYSRGALKESHYWARMNNMVRQLRGKYPGYRAEIDQMVSGVTGARPANALRSALFNEWNDAASKPDEFSKMVDWATKQGHLPVDFFQRQQGEDPYDLTELSAHVSTRTRQQVEITNMKDNLSLAASRGEVADKGALKTFRIESNQVVSNLLQDSASTVGASYKQLTQRVQEAQRAAASGSPLKQEEVNQMRGMMGELKQTIRQQLHQTYLKSWDGDPAHSYAAMFDKTEYESIVSNAMQPIDLLEQALSSDSPWGVLGATTAMIEAQKTDDGRALLEEMPLAREMAAISSTMGAEALGQFLTLSPTLQKEIDTSMVKYLSLRMINPDRAQGEGITQGFQQIQKHDGDTATYNALTDTWVNLVDQIEKGDVPLGAIQQGVQYMFGPGSDGVMAQLDDASKYEYFKKVSSPAVSKQMEMLRDRGDVDSWQSYQRWVANSFQVLFRDKVQTMQEMVLDPNHFRVTWDDKANRFKTDVRVAGQTFISNPFTSNVDQLNTALQVVAPIVNANDGQTGMEVLSILASMGYDPKATPEGSVLGVLGKAILEKLQSAGDTAKKNAGALPAATDMSGL